MYMYSVTDPGFSPGGAPNSQNSYYFSNFCRKLHKNEQIWTPRRGRASLAPPLDPPMVFKNKTTQNPEPIKAKKQDCHSQCWFLFFCTKFSEEKIHSHHQCVTFFFTKGCLLKLRNHLTPTRYIAVSKRGYPMCVVAFLCCAEGNHACRLSFYVLSSHINDC